MQFLSRFLSDVRALTWGRNSNRYQHPTRDQMIIGVEMKLPSESRSSAMKLSLDPKIQLSIELSSCESNPGISQIFTAVFT